MKCLALLAVFLPLADAAEMPRALASALEDLRNQRSYSWEVINGDPGIVAQRVQTRRGVVTTMQQSSAPNVKGSIDLAGDLLVQREWPDGVRLDTLVTARGETVTLTPEGWMTEREILTAQADERVRNGNTTARATWLRRADRPEIRRPDAELPALLQSATTFEQTSLDTYVVRARAASADRGTDSYDVTCTITLRRGLIGGYEMAVEGTRAVTRARVPVPVNELRIVIISYGPVRQVDVPAAAREKLTNTRGPAKK